MTSPIARLAFVHERLLTGITVVFPTDKNMSPECSAIFQKIIAACCAIASDISGSKPSTAYWSDLIRTAQEIKSSAYRHAELRALETAINSCNAVCAAEQGQLDSACDFTVQACYLGQVSITLVGADPDSLLKRLHGAFTAAILNKSP
jgi:hypothetical protein